MNKGKDAEKTTKLKCRAFARGTGGKFISGMKPEPQDRYTKEDD